MLDVCIDLTASVGNYSMDTKLLTYDNTNITTYKGATITDAVK